MENYEFVRVELENEEHCRNLVTLLNTYMKDPMGLGKSMDAGLERTIVSGLKEHTAYLGFFVKVDRKYVALANCNLVFSTWQAKKIINIHDFIVIPAFRRKGIGKYLMVQIKNYAEKIGCCKLNLEVREDNFNAQSLYKMIGFNECKPRNFFWELWI